MNETVIDQPRHSRFELTVGEVTAAVHYRRDGKTLILDHTDVPSELSGQGVGSRLAKGVFEHLRRNDQKVRVGCSFLRGYLERHSEYSDVVES